MRPRRSLLTCDGCGQTYPDIEDHDTRLSVGAVTFDGVAIVAWCPRCGSDTCR